MGTRCFPCTTTLGSIKDPTPPLRMYKLPTIEESWRTLLSNIFQFSRETARIFIRFIRASIIFSLIHVTGKPLGMEFCCISQMWFTQVGVVEATGVWTCFIRCTCLLLLLWNEWFALVKRVCWQHGCGRKGQGLPRCLNRGKAASLTQIQTHYPYKDAENLVIYTACDPANK